MYLNWVKVCKHQDLFHPVLQSEIDASSPLMYGTPSSRVEGTPRSGIRGTPARQRADLGSVRKAPQVDMHSEPVSESPPFQFKKYLFLEFNLFIFDSLGEFLINVNLKPITS